MRLTKSSQSGSVLIWTVIVITVLSAAAAQVLHVVSAKYHNALHTATWQEALLASESGVDLAIRELRRSLRPAPNQAWDGWANVNSERYGISVVPNAGLAGTEMKIEVNVDAPWQLKDPANLWQYYRVRAIGTMPITGPARAADNKQDTRLRKMSLRADRFTGGVLTSQAVDKPRVSRRVEAIVRPVSAFDQAVVSLEALNLNDANIIIDSYDSRDTTKSTNGLYDVAKRQRNGHIATNSNLINAGNAHVYGDVSTNAGTVSNAANVTGVQRTDFYQEPIPVGAPTWPSVNASPSLVLGLTTLNASATEGSAASRYVLSSITLAGTEVLNLAGAADGSSTHIEIYVTGDISATGLSQIVVHPGVKATIYFAGGVKVSGNGLVNKNNQPGNLMMYGITPPPNTLPKTVELGGNGQLTAAVYAPDFYIHMNNTGTRGIAYGSFVGKTFTMTGTTDLHYDEALGSMGRISNYKIVSWFEDTR
ncbi:MAG: hypothetical protein H0W20_11015 [Chthoniobacterales bacterium]|nr:hypothetical protein [Chthoniobacterales bacterium]